MPIIAAFYGVTVRMFYDEHNPPHFHASYQDYTAEFFMNGDLLKGDMPTKQRKQITAWAKIHEEELLKNWMLMRKSEEPFRIN